MPNSSCECGHRKEEHQGGEHCEACGCLAFEEAVVLPFVCTECGCASVEEICKPCQKKITDNCPGDLILYLFGVKGDYPAINKIKAKRLAMDICAANVDVRELWRRYNS